MDAHLARIQDLLIRLRVSEIGFECLGREPTQSMSVGGFT